MLNYESNHVSIFCVFWCNQWMLGWSFFCLRWINDTSAPFTTSSSPQILQVRHEFDWDYPTLYQSSAKLVLCGRISKHCAKSRPWQGEMGSVTAKCSKEAAFGAGIGLLVLIAVWCWCNMFLLGGGLRSFQILQDFINAFHFFLTDNFNEPC